MKIHVCLYLNGLEVININEVFAIHFVEDHIVIITMLSKFRYSYQEFDKIEVDYYD